MVRAPYFSPYFYGYPYGVSAVPSYPPPYLPAATAWGTVNPPPVAENTACPVPVAGDVVGNVQRALKYRGFYRGPIDGLSGPPLRAAIRAYDASVGLPPPGAIDARLLSSLGIL